MPSTECRTARNAAPSERVHSHQINARLRRGKCRQIMTIINGGPRQTLLDNAQAIVARAKAQYRDLTADEGAEIDELLKAVDVIDEKAEHSKSVMSNLVGYGSGDNDAVSGDGAAPRTSNGYNGVKAGSAWAAKAVEDVHRAGQGIGVKALLQGRVRPSTDVVAAIPDGPARILTLVSRGAFPVNQHGGNTYSYLRQTVRTDNAAFVPDHGVKPVSEYVFDEVENRSHVVAHLTKAMPVRYLEDHASLIQVLDHQLRNGIFQALEHGILYGDGTADQFTGILTTEGVLDVPAGADMLTTLRRARTALESRQERVTGVAMHPNDVEKLTLLRENGDAGRFLVDGDVYARIFGPDVQAVASLAVPEGTAIVGDWSAARLLVHEGEQALVATQSLNENGQDMFERNEVRIRCEGRYAFELTRPGAFAVVHLTSTAGA
ncbi:phage major capsid protein [Micrococcus luteus]|uniref:phage major capsid protein n=1 Tax=Micrococcus luteus TaxID=1270 RepID=UPI0021022DB6|nr:phage major capsid protein [Micrococcus luteus]UTX33734.1 phage major capsid protein [Micrococcus luteus]